MVQLARKGRLHPAVGAARVSVARALNDVLGQGTVLASGRKSSASSPQKIEDTGNTEQKPLVLVGLSGGSDSLALASVAAHFARRGEIQVGAVVVDHQLQEGSAEVAQKAADQARELGLSPVLVETVTVDASSGGPEMAARIARYGAFERAVSATDARAVLLAHTLDDQAETVLLGLARGSGTRSLAGIPRIRTENGVTYLRPLLDHTRAEIQDICAAEDLEPWNDPTNTDESLMRARVRHRIMPYLEENLGGAVATSLARTAAIIGPDSEFLEASARKALAQVCLEKTTLTSANGRNITSVEELLQIPENARETHEIAVILDRQVLAELHPAMRRRVLALAVTEAGGETPGFERLSALDDFALTCAKGGPVQMAGHVVAYKTRPPVQSAGSTGREKGKGFSATGILVLMSRTEPTTHGAS